MNVDKYAQLCEKIKQLPCFDLRDDESLLITKIEAGQSSSCFDVSITNSIIDEFNICIEYFDDVFGEPI